ncbi:MAG: hypothetical protein AAF085_08625 [Planctomycetota bacterium]
METNTLLELRKLFIDPKARKVEPGQIGGASMITQQRDADASDDRTMPFVLQTTDIARDGMVITGRAFERRIGIFKRNPIMKISHLDVGPAGEPTGIGRWVDLTIDDKGTRGVVRFTEATKHGREYNALYRDGTYNMVSVEWLNFESREKPVLHEGKRVRVPHIEDAELLAADAVAVGSDRGALAIRAINILGRLSGRTGEDPAAKTARRLEELLGPSLERIHAKQDAIGDELGIQRRGTLLAGEPEDLARFWKEMEDKLEETVERAVQRIFNDDPDGMLTRVITDAIQAGGRIGGQVNPDGGLYEDPDEGGDEPTGLDRLARQLAGN